MSNFDPAAFKRLAVLDQSASVEDDFISHIFNFNVWKLLITDQGETVAAVVKSRGSLLPDKIYGYKVVVLPYEFCVYAHPPGLPLSGLVHMATRGGFALAHKTGFHPIEHLLVIPSTEKFYPDNGNVIVLEGTEPMRIGYQLYCADPSVGQKVMGGPIPDFEEYVRAETERVCT